MRTVTARTRRPEQRHLADQEPVAWCDRLKANLFQRAVAMQDGRPGNARQDCRHLMSRVPLGECVEVLAARIHQCDHDCGKLLADDKRSRHRQRCNNVESNLVAPKAKDNLRE